MRKKLQIIIEDNTSPKGKVFDYFIQFLILLSLIAFTVETLPDNSANTIKLLNAFELICVIIFSIEYVLRIYVSKKSKVQVPGVPSYRLPVCSSCYCYMYICSEEGFEAENIPPLTFSTSLCFSTLVQNVSKSSVKCSSSFSPNTPVLNGPNCSMFSSSSSENSS